MVVPMLGKFYKVITNYRKTCLMILWLCVLLLTQHLFHSKAMLNDILRLSRHSPQTEPQPTQASGIDDLPIDLAPRVGSIKFMGKKSNLPFTLTV